MLAKNNLTLAVALQATGEADPAGDKAFDPEEFPAFVPSAFAGLPVVPQ